MGQWRIDVNQNAGPGCFAVRNFVDPNSEVQMGINATSTPPSGYLSIFVQGYEGIEPGQSIPATFAVGDREFRGTFTGQDTAGFGGATVPVDNADFIYSLADQDDAHHHLRRRPPGDRPARGRRPGHRRPARLPGRPVARSAPAPRLRGAGARRPPLLLAGCGA